MAVILVLILRENCTLRQFQYEYLVTFGCKLVRALHLAFLEKCSILAVPKDERG